MAVYVTKKLNCPVCHKEVELLCMSHPVTRWLLTKVGIGHYDKVKGWRDLFTEHLVMAPALGSFVYSQNFPRLVHHFSNLPREIFNMWWKQQSSAR